MCLTGTGPKHLQILLNIHINDNADNKASTAPATLLMPICVRTHTSQGNMIEETVLEKRQNNDQHQFTKDKNSVNGNKVECT